jgi:hypothetical protein
MAVAHSRFKAKRHADRCEQRISGTSAQASRIGVIANWPRESLADSHVRCRFIAANSALQAEQAERRIADLRVKELRGEVILPANPNVQFKTLERRGSEGPRAKNE